MRDTFTCVKKYIVIPYFRLGRKTYAFDGYYNNELICIIQHPCWIDLEFLTLKYGYPVEGYFEEFLKSFIHPVSVTRSIVPAGVPSG